MNMQSHFEPKATLRASSAFDARPLFRELEGVLPVVGRTAFIPSCFMSSHLDRFLRDEARLLVVKGPF